MISIILRYNPYEKHNKRTMVPGMVTRRKGLSLCQISRRGNYMMTFPDLIPDIIPAEKKPIDPPMVYEEYDEDD